MHKIKIFLNMIKFEHTVFALPFAYLGAFLASNGLPNGWKLLWITLAMIGARTAALSLNRLIDRHIDALNPRTATRALPKGQLKLFEVYISIVLSFLLLGYAAYRLNMLAFKLMPIAVFFLFFYSYTKRFTWTCHFFLGMALGLAPLGAWIGVLGYWALLPVILGLGVTVWVAGFDIIYACQDVEFDCKKGLHSIPARFGLANSLIISKILHVFAALLFLTVGILAQLSVLYFAGLAIAVYLLYRQQRLVTVDDLSKVNIAFFNLNGYLSVCLFVFTAADLYFRDYLKFYHIFQNWS